MGNRIAFVSTATCKNKGRNSPLTPGIVFWSQSLSHAFNDAATPLCLLGEIGVNSTPRGKRIYRELVKMFLAKAEVSNSSVAHSLQQLPRARPGDRKSGERSTFWMFPGVF